MIMGLSPKTQRKGIGIVGKTGTIGEPWSTADYVIRVPKDPNGKNVKGGDVIDLANYERR